MAPGKDPSNMADLAASHLKHLNRNPGIEARESVKPFSVTSRQLLANKELFGEETTLSYRQRANGTILIQCVDFFAEFLPGQSGNAPASLDNEDYCDQFWELIKDMFPYKHVSSTRNMFKLVYDLLMNGRRNFKINNPGKQLREISQEERFFLECLDEHEAHRTHGFSHAQLKYGERRDDNFAVRLVTRVRQWRDLTSPLSELDALRFKWPVLSVDVAPVGEWDNKFVDDANNFSSNFRKPVLQLRSAGPIAHASANSNDSTEMSLVKHMHIHVATLVSFATIINKDVVDIKKKAANIKRSAANEVDDVDEVREDVAHIKEDVANIKKNIQALKERSDDIFKAVASLKSLYTGGRKQDTGREPVKKDNVNKRPRGPD